MALAALLGFNLYLSPAAVAQQTPVPDAPAPQAPKPLSDINGPITPGLGAGKEKSAAASSSSDNATQETPPTSEAPATEPKDNFQAAAPENKSAEDIGTIIRLDATYVEVPITVKDSKGKMVAGLDWRDFKVYENDTRENIRFFTADA